MDLAVTINSDETAQVSMEVQDQSGFATRDQLDCSDFEDEVVGGEGAQVTVEEIGEEGSLGCRITGTGAIADMDGEGMSIVKDGDNYVFTFEGDESMDPADFSQLPGGMEPEISISVTFPGAVVSADDNGEISGNTVRWSGLETFAQGGTATGSAVAGGGGGGNAVIWIVLGVVVLLAIVAIIILLAMRKKGSNAPGGPGGPAGPGGPGGPTGYGGPGAAGYQPGGGQGGVPPVPPAPGQTPPAQPMP